MPPFAKLTSATGVILLVALVAVTIWKLARKQLSRDSTLRSNARKLRFIPQLFRDPFRLLSLAATLLVAINYIVLMIRNPAVLPEVPKPLLTLLAVVNAMYLANKWRTISAARSRNL